MLDKNEIPKSKSYRIKYLRNKKRCEIVFPIDEYFTLLKKASDHRCSIGEFIKFCTFSFLKEKYLLHDPVLLHALIVEIRRIGTNVNQISRKMNDSGALYLIDSLSFRIKELETIVRSSILNPPKLLDEVYKSLSDPYFLYQLELMIYNKKVTDDSKNKHMEGS